MIRREQTGVTTIWLLFVGALVALSACAVEPAPPYGGYYTWYDGFYYPWYYRDYYYWPGVTVEGWGRYRGWHGGWHGHGVVPHGRRHSSTHRNAVPREEEG